MAIHPLAQIHPSALIDEGVSIGKHSRIGAFCTIEKEACIEDEVLVHQNVVIKGDTVIGKSSEIHPFAVIGDKPQDLKYQGEKTQVIIGPGCKIREHVTVHCGTIGGGGVTSIGQQCLVMVGAHIAHDCQLGDHVVMANNCALAGHVIVGNHCILGGYSTILQFSQIGDYAMVCGMTGVANDVIPYGMVFGNRGLLNGLNVIGLKRHGFKKETIKELMLHYKAIFKSNRGTLRERAMQQKEECVSDSAHFMVDFLLRTDSKNNYCVAAKS